MAMHAWSRVALTIGLFSFAVPSMSAQPPALELVGRLRDGGYVLAIRHTDSPMTLPDKTSAAAGNSTLERQLSESGRAAAENIGKAIKTLRVPVADVYSSPTFRALQTAKLMQIGTAKSIVELGEGEQGMAADADTKRSAFLKNAVAKAPKARANTIIITHMPNLRGAFGTDAENIAAGEAMVFHPDGKGGTQFVGRIKTEEWLALAAVK